MKIIFPNKMNGVTNLLRFSRIFLLCLVLGGSSAVMAATANLASTTTVDPINQVSLTNKSLTLPNDIGHSTNDHRVFDFNVDNNDPDSFKVVLSSDNNGQLRHTGLDVDSDPVYGAGKPGSYLDYTVSVVLPTPTFGTLGSTPPALLTDVSLLSNQEMSFSNATEATIAWRYELHVKHATKTSLLEGHYEDTLWVTITDL